MTGDDDPIGELGHAADGAQAGEPDCQWLALQNRSRDTRAL